MNYRTAIIPVVALLAAADPAQAGWKLIDAQQPVTVAKGELTVTPSEEWNRNDSRPVKTSEVWTLDGTGLNELYFVGDLVPGDTLLRDRDNKNNPLPKLQANMLLTDIPEFYESSIRVGAGISLFEIDTVEPATLAGHPGVHFTFHYAVNGTTVTYKGTARGTLVDGKLFLISFVAPSLHYFDRDAPKAEAIMDSAVL